MVDANSIDVEKGALRNDTARSDSCVNSFDSGPAPSPRSSTSSSLVRLLRSLSWSCRYQIFLKLLRLTKNKRVPLFASLIQNPFGLSLILARPRPKRALSRLRKMMEDSPLFGNVSSVEPATSEKCLQDAQFRLVRMGTHD